MQLLGLDAPQNQPTDRWASVSGADLDDNSPLPEETSEDDYFLALCGTLPDDVRNTYFSYGADFKSGYIALNRGDFLAAALAAAESLTRAMAQNPQTESYIPLELASAWLDLDRAEEARELLDNFLKHRPDALLACTPEDLAESLAAVLLKDETLLRAGRPAEARDFYRHFLDIYGWNDAVARGLANAHENLNESAEARTVYREIMGRCDSCRARIGTNIRHRYAELSFAGGLYTPEILEMYLALAREKLKTPPSTSTASAGCKQPKATRWRLSASGRLRSGLQRNAIDPFFAEKPSA